MILGQANFSCCLRGRGPGSWRFFAHAGTRDGARRGEQIDISCFFAPRFCRLVSYMPLAHDSFSTTASRYTSADRALERLSRHPPPQLGAPDSRLCSSAFHALRQPRNAQTFAPGAAISNHYTFYGCSDKTASSAPPTPKIRLISPDPRTER